MSESNNDIKGKALSLQESIAYSPGAVVSKTLLEKKTGTITIFAFDQGQNLSEHTAPFDATVIITEGEAAIRVDQTVHTIKEGEMIIMPANIPHALDAKKKFKMILVMIKEIK